jgi:hypothetical protein
VRVRPRALFRGEVLARDLGRRSRPARRSRAACSPCAGWSVETASEPRRAPRRAHRAPRTA